MHMLTLELAGQAYNKSAHRRSLSIKLNGRSDPSIERKHQNISAVLGELGCHWISGYKPLPNYQQALFDAVTVWLQSHTEFDRAALAAAEMPAARPLITDFSALLVEAPRTTIVDEARASYAFQHTAHPQRDYVAREARNASLGLAGEELVLAYERQRLITHGCDALADRIEHVSKNRGDGAGFDVLSFETSGAERFIEVKTTAFGKQTPFFASRNEVEFAKAYEHQFRLYRLFDFRRAPRLFELQGQLERHCKLDPVSYLCRL
jgi:hypothetical protein